MLSANYAFHNALVDGCAFPDRPSEDDPLVGVWAQEIDIRADTMEWTYGYLAPAYQPHSDADLDACIAFRRTDRGRALNEAIFTAVNDMSREFGLRAVRFMTGEDI